MPSFEKIVEEKDANAKEKKVTEVNTGVYAMGRNFLFDSLKKIKTNNAQNEFYLTDVIHRARSLGESVSVFMAPEPAVFQGVNRLEELAMVEKVARKNKCAALMKKGVRILDPDHTYIEQDVSIGTGTVIYPGCTILGKTQIGKKCMVGPQAYLEDCKVGNEVRIKPFSVLESSQLGDEAQVGPHGALKARVCFKESS